jgi:hypothetical protein
MRRNPTQTHWIKLASVCENSCECRGICHGLFKVIITHLLINKLSHNRRAQSRTPWLQTTQWNSMLQSHYFDRTKLLTLMWAVQSATISTLSTAGKGLRGSDNLCHYKSTLKTKQSVPMYQVIRRCIYKTSIFIWSLSLTYLAYLSLNMFHFV